MTYSYISNICNRPSSVLPAGYINKFLVYLEFIFILLLTGRQIILLYSMGSFPSTSIFPVLLYLGFCDPCWYLWHAKGSLRRHQKKPVLTGVTIAQEQKIHKDQRVVRIVSWWDDDIENNSLKTKSAYEDKCRLVFIHRSEVWNGTKQQYIIAEADHASGVASTLDAMPVCHRYFQSYYSSYLKA